MQPVVPTKADDLIAFSHLLYFLITETLPWLREVREYELFGDEDSYLSLKQRKARFSRHFKEQPRVFQDFHSYIYSLQPGDTIDYSYHITMFQKYVSEHPSC